MSAATQSDIARLLGISQNTVSLALRSSERISPEMRQRVAEAAKSLSYSPSFAGLAMVTGRLNSLALVIGTDADRSSMSLDLLQGVLDAAGERDRHVQVAKFADDTYHEGRPTPRLLRELAVDGALINYGWGQPPELDLFLVRHDLPALWLNTLRTSNCVRPDDHGAGVQAAEALVAAGCRRLLWADFSMSERKLASGQHYSYSHRAEGFRVAAEATGASARVMRPATDPPYQDYHLIADRLVADLGVGDGVVANGRDTADAVALALRARGLLAGRDLPLVVVADRPAWSLCGGLPTVIVPNHTMGLRGVEVLLQLIEQPKRQVPTVIVPFGWYAGGSSEPVGTDVSGARSA